MTRIIRIYTDFLLQYHEDKIQQIAKYHNMDINIHSNSAINAAIKSNPFMSDNNE